MSKSCLIIYIFLDGAGSDGFLPEPLIIKSALFL